MIASWQTALPLVVAVLFIMGAAVVAWCALYLGGHADQDDDHRPSSKDRRDG